MHRINCDANFCDLVLFLSCSFGGHFHTKYKCEEKTAKSPPSTRGKGKSKWHQRKMIGWCTVCQMNADVFVGNSSSQ